VSWDLPLTTDVKRRSCPVAIRERLFSPRFPVPSLTSVVSVQRPSSKWEWQNRHRFWIISQVYAGLRPFRSKPIEKGYSQLKEGQRIWCFSTSECNRSVGEIVCRLCDLSDERVFSMTFTTVFSQPVHLAKFCTECRTIELFKADWICIVHIMPTILWNRHVVADSSGPHSPLSLKPPVFVSQLQAPPVRSK
jgi:hypothetical protein